MKRILQFIHVLFIVHVIIKSFRKEFIKVLLREIKEPGYMSQDQFDNCLSRATAMIEEALIKPKRLYACMILFHRKKSHEEDHTKELSELSRYLSKSEVKIAVRAAGWWNG